jgi:hypothetical protein
VDNPSQHGVTEADRDPTPPALRFERRLQDRWPCRGTATAYRVAGQHFGQRHVLKLVDESCEGLGAITAQPLEPGAVVSVGFATLGLPTKSGVVLRCAPCGDGYRVAIRFEHRLAA